MHGYLAYEAWNEHMADLQRDAERRHAARRRRRHEAPHRARAGLRRLRQALAS
jgi:hypothetical protein